MIANGVGVLHLLPAIGITWALAGGIYGLGDLVTSRGGIGNRWIHGWTAMWWIVALSAEFVGPRAGVACGALAAIAGLGRIVRRPDGHRRTAFAALGASIVGAPLWLAPPHFYDALVYHLGLPWSWLVNGSFAPVEHDLFSHFPLAASTVYLLPVAAGVPEAAAGLHWLTFAAALVAVSGLAKNLGAGRWSWMAAALLGGTWQAPWLASLAGADHLVVLGIVVAAELLTAPRGDDRLPWVDIGVALGFALASKYTASVPVAAFLVAAFVLCRSRRDVIGAGATALAASSFWWVRNAATVGNPFHPLFWNWFGGGGWTAEEYARYTGRVREGVTDATSCVVGVIHLAAPAQLGLSFGVASVVALAALFATGPASRHARVVGATALLTLAGWSVTAQTGRYAIPAVALAAALAAAGLAQLAPLVARFAATASGAAAAHGVLQLGLFLFGSLGVQRSWLGPESREAWRHAVTRNDPAPAYRAAETLLPSESRILVVGEGRPFGCPRPHQVSSPYDTQWLQAVVERSATAEEVRRTLAAAGWTHLLFNWAEINRLGGDNYGVLRWRTPEDLERYRDFGKRLTERIWVDGALEIRALREEAPGVAVR